MSVLADHQIRKLGIVNPCEEGIHRPGVISYGLTSYGYDFRIGNRLKIFTACNAKAVDPKNIDPEALTELEPKDGRFILPPHSYALGESVEKVRMPREYVAVCVGKSTYARSGLIVNVTPLEPSWAGTITIEITNSTPCPAYVYANEGIMQVQFHRGEEECEISYADKQGKYQNQKGITLPKVIQ